MATAVTTPPAPSAVRNARLLAADIKLHHSVFAMPFAVLAAFMAAAGTAGGIDWSRFAVQLALVVAAMVFARTVAMLANRVLDRGIDATNPRTAGRALPSGRVSPRAALAFAAAGSAGFAAVCAGFGVLDGNWWPAILCGPVLAWLCLYPLLKRFTALCHLYLGSSLAMSPLAAAIAVRPAALQEPALWLLAAMVMAWVAGFDVIYALQDVEVDRREGHFSLPARVGVVPALWISRLLHVAAIGCLTGVAAADPRLGMPFAVAVVAIAALLAAEHLTVARWGTTRLALAFFTLNGAVSCLLGVAGVVDILVGR